MLIRVHNNVHVYDMRSKINVSVLRPDFTRYYHLSPSANGSLDNTGNLVVTASDFKQFSSVFAEGMMARVVLSYVQARSTIEPQQEFTFQASRLIVMPLNPSPTIPLQGVTGVMCMGRENVIGGVLEIPAIDFARELMPGEMILMPDNHHMSLSKVNVMDNNSDGNLDLIMFKALKIDKYARLKDE